MNNPVKEKEDHHPRRRSRAIRPARFTPKVRRGRGYNRAEYGATNSSRLKHDDIRRNLGFRVVRSKP